MSITINPDVVFPGKGLLAGNGYIVCTTVRTYGPICTKCTPVWQPLYEGRLCETHAEAREIIAEHDKATHRPQLEEHGEHYCGSSIVYDPSHDVHLCTGMHDDPDIVIEPGECETCNERGGTS